MNVKRVMTALGLGLALMTATQGVEAATATNPSNLDLRVTFTGNFSVVVDGVQYSTRTFATTANELIVPSSATVVNDSTGLTEKWQLHVATVAGNGDWASQASTDTAPGTDQYALQALFISSATAAVCPNNVDSLWDSNPSIVTETPQTYTTALFADATAQGGATGDPDGTSGGADGNMFANSSFPVAEGRGRRGLCVRLYGPAGSTSPTEQVIRMTITAVAGG